jgi:hypothetical protein
MYFDREELGIGPDPRVGRGPFPSFAVRRVVAVVAAAALVVALAGVLAVLDERRVLDRVRAEERAACFYAYELLPYTPYRVGGVGCDLPDSWYRSRLH